MTSPTWLTGKTAIAAYGFIGMAVYQASQKQYDLALQSLLAAFGLIGVRHAVAKVPGNPS
jgi:hypothetical protein